MRKRNDPLLTLAMLGIMGGLQGVSTYDMRKTEKKPQMPLTDQELKNMASLSGKEKKKYIKELKLKYQGEAK